MAFSGGLQQVNILDKKPLLFGFVVFVEWSSANFSFPTAATGIAFSFLECLLLAMLPLRLFGLILPLDPLLDVEMGSAVVFSLMEFELSVLIFAFDDERNGT